MRRSSQLARALRLLQKGRLDGAELICRRLIKHSPQDAPAIHMLGIIRKTAGDNEAAELYMRKSLQLESRIVEFHTNLATVLRRLGRLDEAVHKYRDALALEPGNKAARVGLVCTLNDLGLQEEAEQEALQLTRTSPVDPEAWATQAMIFRDRGRLAESEAAYRKSLMLAPAYASAHHNLGSLLSLMDRAEESLESLERARSLGVSGYELSFNLGRTLLQLYRFHEAEQAFASAVAERPMATDAQINLAQVRFMQKDPDFARDIAAAAAAHREDRGMRMLFGLMLRRAGDLQSAENHFRDMLADHGPVPDVQSALAEVLHEMGRLPEAEKAVLAAAATKPDDPIIVENLAAILLANGHAERALPFLRVQRARAPFDQGWLAYEATAARFLGQDLYREWYDYDRLVKAFEVEVPAGWSSMAELNAALLEALNQRHRFPTHPLDQSLRNGSQTARSMLTDPDPAIRSVIQAFSAPLEEYRRALGTDSQHPVSARNSGPARITGAWSVQLRRDGFHVNHFHPQGWISSAYYVSVPEEVHDRERKSGWIKFGEPRFPVPGATAGKTIQPRAGRLVLFPSYMWHGTNPITGAESRTTIAFDASPP